MKNSHKRTRKVYSSSSSTSSTEKNTPSIAAVGGIHKAGTSRTPDGGLSGSAGRLEVLDAVLASRSGLADPLAGLKASLEEAAAKAGYGEEGSDAAASAGHYARAAQKLSEKGNGYLAKELKRLEGLLGGGGGATISAQKRTLFMVRSNILRAFEEFGFGEGGEGAAEL